MQDPVEKMLQDARAEEENRFKILLLGPGESGKSTVVKQVKLIYKVRPRIFSSVCANLGERRSGKTDLCTIKQHNGNTQGGMSEKEKEEFVAAIRRNTLECMQTLTENMFKLGLNVEDPSLAEAADELAGIDSNCDLTIDLANKISALWTDPGVQATFARRDEFWILDACKYYFQEVHRFADEDYQPTEEDILMTRVRTTGIVLTEFQEGPFSYTIVDVGGQRSERRKWIHCFDDVKAIIFLVGLSGYHQVMFEDNSQLMLHESLTLFQEIVKCADCSIACARLWIFVAHLFAVFRGFCHTHTQEPAVQGHANLPVPEQEGLVRGDDLGGLAAHVLPRVRRPGRRGRACHRLHR